MRIAIDIDLLFGRLAEMERAASAVIPDGWELPPELQPDYFSLLADLVGLPADTSCDDHDEIAPTFTSCETRFCRDWWQWRWDEMLRGRVSLDEVLDDLMNAAKLFGKAGLC